MILEDMVLELIPTMEKGLLKFFEKSEKRDGIIQNLLATLRLFFIPIIKHINNQTQTFSKWNPFNQSWEWIEYIYKDYQTIVQQPLQKKHFRLYNTPQCILNQPLTCITHSLENTIPQFKKWLTKRKRVRTLRPLWGQNWGQIVI